MKDNKLIAEFMGLENPFNEINDATLYKYKGVDEKGEFQFNIELHEMRYHTSWDWLKPVIDKLREECGIVTLSSRMHVNLYSDIGEVYEAVVDFIKTYNDEQQLHY